ncbi:hypothetical protein OAB68_01235 [Candidatus Pelagibacter ubique]|nr:hypothetical protein [Candidatus Pelagibacter ubique]
MKKILILIIFASLFVSINAHSIESGHQIKDSEGNKMYFSLKKNKYIYCKDFVLEGSVIITDSGFTLTPICDKNDLSLSNLEGVKTLDFSKLEGVIDISSGLPINSNGEPAKLKVQELKYGYELRFEQENEYTPDDVWIWNGKNFLTYSDWKKEKKNNLKNNLKNEIDFSKFTNVKKNQTSWDATCVDVDTEQTFRCPDDVVKEFFKDEQSIFSSLGKLFESSETTVSTKKTKDVKGKKLFCLLNNEATSGFGVEFNSSNKVKLRAIDEDNEKLFTINGKYQSLSDKIIIEYKNLDNSDTDMTINRKTLKINGVSSSSCKTIKKSSSIEAKLKLALDKLISEKSSDNKF